MNVKQKVLLGLGAILCLVGVATATFFSAFSAFVPVTLVFFLAVVGLVAILGGYLDTVAIFVATGLYCIGLLVLNKIMPYAAGLAMGATWACVWVGGAIIGFAVSNDKETRPSRYKDDDDQPGQ